MGTLRCRFKGLPRWNTEEPLRVLGFTYTSSRGPLIVKSSYLRKASPVDQLWIKQKKVLGLTFILENVLVNEMANGCNGII